MQTFGAFLVSLIAATGVVAVPVAETGTGSVAVEYNKNYVPHGPTALLKAKLKYGRPVSDKLRAAAARKNDLVLHKRQSTGSVPTNPDSSDDEWITIVNIGTPAQKIPLDFDTGSSDLWVISTSTPKSESSGHVLYNPANSSTAKKVSNGSWKIGYGDGSSASGTIYTDVVNIGGVSFSTQGVETATQISGEFEQDTDISGLVGLAWNSINSAKPKQKTFFSNVQSQLKAPLFTANLNHQAPGTYNFGYIDSSEYSGTLLYTPVDNSQGFWGFTAKGYAIGGGRLNSNSIDGIADTGTTLLLLDDDVVSDYYNQIDSAEYNDEQQGYVFDCDADIPTFSFGVGSGSITVSAELLNLGTIDNEGQQCFGGIQSDEGEGAIFGDIAIKAALVVFDGGNTRLGWAQK